MNLYLFLHTIEVVGVDITKIHGVSVRSLKHY